MRGVYTTIYLPPWLRLLGARIGRRTEISTVSQVAPDLIEIDDESFFADGSMIGGRHFFRGHVQIGRNRIGRRSFVGNNAILPMNRHLGANCLLGVLSSPPLVHERTPDGSEWLGSPSFILPYRRKVETYDASVTYAPTPKLYAQRLLIDGIRILVPPTFVTLGGVAFVTFLLWALRHLPLSAALALTPAVAFAVAVGVALCVVVLKRLVMGRFEPVIKPLWCTYVWWNEVINGAFETVSAPMLAPLVGSPFFNWYLQRMGCRIGKRTYIGTTLFSEFDLVEIGDRVALNAGVVVQNHLFEDRIMKSSHIKIGDECSIGNMAVILYDTKVERGSSVGPLSLLMKGESLPVSTRWIGIPTSRQ
jgi:non-ribosomal peptide synthetase-like protein